MKKIILVLLLFLSLIFAEDKSVKVTYIANEGFLVEIDSTKFLIDALFNDYTINFAHVPSKQTLSKIVNGKEKFNNIDYLFVTHNHRDHFNSEVVAEFLLKNRNCKLISTPQVQAALKTYKDFNLIRNQIISVLPGKGDFKKINFDDIEIKVFRLSHSTYMITDPKTGKRIDKHANIQNLGFLINVTGIKVFHNGDSFFSKSDEYKKYDISKEEIDIAFVSGGYTSEKNLKLIDELINSDKVVFMHLDPDSFKKYYTKFKETQKYIVFKQPNETIDVKLKK